MKKSKDNCPPDLEGLGEKIDVYFRSITECLYSWIDCHHYRDLIEEDKRFEESSLPFKTTQGRCWLIKQIKKSLTQLSKRFNNDCPYLNFKFHYEGYINWLEEKGKTNSLICHKSHQRYSSQEIMEILKEGN
tara:strand:- start:427 stop:822 length:396 start_codon:yes stop_codon:yes gene_type:complete